MQRQNSLGLRFCRSGWVGSLTFVLSVVILCTKLYWLAEGNLAFLWIPLAMVGEDNYLTRSSVAALESSSRSMLSRTNVRRAVGIWLVLSGQPQEAQQHLGRLVRTTDSVMVRYWLGMAAERTGDYIAGLSYMYSAGNHEYFPDLTALPGDTVQELARQALTQSVSGRAHLELAKMVYEFDHELARRNFEAAYQAAPESLASVAEPAWFYLERGDIDRARIFGERAMRNYPEEAWVQLLLAELNLAQGRTEDAVRAFRALLTQVAPVSHAAYVVHYELGRIYYRYGDFVRAESEFLIANDINPDQWSIQLQLAQTEAQMGECGEAAKFLTRAETLLPDREARRTYLVPVEHSVDGLCPQ